MNFSWTPHRFSGGALALDVANSVVLRFDAERRIDRYADVAALDDFAAAASGFSAERTLFGPLSPVAAQNRTAFLALREAVDAHFRAQVLGTSSAGGLANLLDATSNVIRHHPLVRFPMDCSNSVGDRGHFPPSVGDADIFPSRGEIATGFALQKKEEQSPRLRGRGHDVTEGGELPQTHDDRSAEHHPTATPLDAATALSALSLITVAEPERLKICPNCTWLFLDRSRNRSRTWCDMTVCGNRAKASRHYRRQKEDTA